MASSARSRGGGGGHGGSSGGHDGAASAVAAAAAASMDSRLQFASMPDWQRGNRQPVLSSDYVILEPTTRVETQPSQLDFDLPRKEPLLFGPMCKFRVKGAFQKQEENQVAWANAKAAEIAAILLAPNWLEMLLKEVSVWHNNNKIASTNENRFIWPFLNTYLYHNMDPLAKQLLCPQACHPGHCVPAADGKWSADAAAYTDYAKKVFTGTALAFDYTPLFVFPFYQGGTYLIEDNVPRILPAPSMNRVQIRFTFFDSQDHIFRKTAPDTNKAKYRFAFSEFSLVLEEARLSESFGRHLHNIKRPLAFPGVTRLQLVENLVNGMSSIKARFQDIYLPEHVFVFCLNKAVGSGTFKFSGDTSTNVFLAHNIESVDLSFDGKRFSLQEPKNVGSFRPDMFDIKAVLDHLVNPPFGIRQDPKKVTVDYVANGSLNTAFPHLHIPLVVGPERQRLVPASDDGSCINKKADLDLDFKFTEDNAPNDAILVIYAVYTDVNIVFDPKTKHFSSPYLQYMN